MSWAARDLLDLEPDGLQLTPGNVPTVGFVDELVASNVTFMSHQGFCESAYRQPVWDGIELLVSADSVHPPHRSDVDSDAWFAACERGDFADTIMEVMYGPEHLLGSGRQVERAMDAGMRLAIDVSHVYIQLTQGRMQTQTWDRLRDYNRVGEIHLSANDGASDSHRPLTNDMFGFGWAMDKVDQVTVVVESYMHRLDDADRRTMLKPLLDRLR